MTNLAIRQRLFEYIRFADDKKIKAIYTIVEDEINEKHDIWTKEFTVEMNKRATQMEKNNIGSDWTNVKEKARKIVGKK